MPPATSADRTSGNVTKRNVWLPWAPRSADASRRFGLIRRSRAMTLLYAITTQNVAWAMTSEWNPNPTRKSNSQTSIRAVERVLQGDGGDDARQRDGQHEQERNGIAAEEPVALHRERGERSEHAGRPPWRRRRASPSSTARRADRRISQAWRHQSSVMPRRRPRQGCRRVQRQHGDDDERQVEEEQGDDHPAPQRQPGEEREPHRQPITGCRTRPAGALRGGRRR